MAYHIPLDLPWHVEGQGGVLFPEFFAVFGKKPRQRLGSTLVFNEFLLFLEGGVGQGGVWGSNKVACNAYYYFIHDLSLRQSIRGERAVKTKLQMSYVSELQFRYRRAC